MVSLMQAMSSLPLFLFALPAGALADLVNRRQLILFAQAGALLTAMGMAALAWFGMLNQSLLLLATFQLGLAAAFTTPAWQALIPEIVGREQLPQAIALSGIGYNIARAVGPIAGGLLLAATGAGTGLRAERAVIRRGDGGDESWHLHRHAAQRAAGTDARRDGGGDPLRPPRIGDAFGAGPRRRAYFRCGGSGGAAADHRPLAELGGFGFRDSDGLLRSGGDFQRDFHPAPDCARVFRFDQILVGASLVSAVATAVVGIVPGQFWMGAVLMVTGAAWMTGMNTFSVASQNAFPNWVRARSSAIYLVVMQGSSAVGAIVWGQLTGHFSAPVALAVAAAGLLVSGILSRLLPISHVQNLDLTPSNHWHGHTLANEPAPDDGPILITIDTTSIPRKRWPSARRCITCGRRGCATGRSAARCSSIWTIPRSIGRPSSSAHGPSTCGNTNAPPWKTTVSSRRWSVSIAVPSRRSSGIC